jgi:hypothetical protein
MRLYASKELSPNSTRPKSCAVSVQTMLIRRHANLNEFDEAGVLRAGMQAPSVNLFLLLIVCVVQYVCTQKHA